MGSSLRNFSVSLIFPRKSESRVWISGMGLRKKPLKALRQSKSKGNRERERVRATSMVNLKISKGTLVIVGVGLDSRKPKDKFPI